jgi:hypothetical protein
VTDQQDIDEITPAPTDPTDEPMDPTDEEEYSHWLNQHEKVTYLGRILQQSHEAAELARQAVEDLNGPRLYAIEYAEGVGPDIVHHLGDAQRSLRAARALHICVAGEYPHPGAPSVTQ